LMLLFYHNLVKKDKKKKASVIHTFIKFHFNLY